MWVVPNGPCEVLMTSLGIKGQRRRILLEGPPGQIPGNAELSLLLECLRQCTAVLITAMSCLGKSHLNSSPHALRSHRGDHRWSIQVLTLGLVQDHAWLKSIAVLRYRGHRGAQMQRVSMYRARHSAHWH